MGSDCSSRKCVSERKRELVIGNTSFVRETMLSKAVGDKGIFKMFSHVCLNAFNGKWSSLH